MKNEIKNLADDIELKGSQRKAFIAEMTEATSKIKSTDWNKFYKIADKVMQKYQ